MHKHLGQTREHNAESRTAASRCAKRPVAMASLKGMQCGYEIDTEYCNLVHLLCKNTHLQQLLLDASKELLAGAACLRTICKGYAFRCNAE